MMQNRKSAGTGDRSERIRTVQLPTKPCYRPPYWFNTSKVDRVLAGKIDEIVDAFTILYDHTEKLSN